MAFSNYVRKVVTQYNKANEDQEGGKTLNACISGKNVSQSYAANNKRGAKPVAGIGKTVTIPLITSTREDNVAAFRKPTASFIQNSPRNYELPPKPPLFPRPKVQKCTSTVSIKSSQEKDAKVVIIQNRAPASKGYSCLPPQKPPSFPPPPPPKASATKQTTVKPQPKSYLLPAGKNQGLVTSCVADPGEKTKTHTSSVPDPPAKVAVYTPLQANPMAKEDYDAYDKQSEKNSPSNEFETPDESEANSGENGGNTSPPQYFTDEVEVVQRSTIELEIEDSDEEWKGNESENNRIDSVDDYLDVQIRHKRESHGLVTKTFNDASDINAAMKYVSGFYDLPLLAEIYKGNGKESNPTTMDAAAHKNGVEKIFWKDLPVVKSNPVFKKMDDHNLKLHETIFEIMTTEALYICLLNTFEDQKNRFPTEDVLSNSDREMLFSRLLLVKQCAESFYQELEDRWQESILLHGIFDLIDKQVTNNFSVYVKYCTKQGHINKQFKKFKISSSSGALSPQMQAFQSYLMLPMQRITRLLLLVESVLQQMSDTHEEFSACKRAVHALRKKVDECTEDDQSGDRMGGLLELSTRFVFSEDMQPFPLISASRWLRKRGEATLRWRQDAHDGKASSKGEVEMFLFNDVFFICTRKGRDESYLVVSYCRHSLVEMTHVQADFLPTLPLRYATDRHAKYVFVVDILHNQDGRREIMVMSTSNQHERDGWLEAAPPPPVPDASADICYEPWDCPLVVAILPFKAATPYQLSLAVHDKLLVTKRKTIGWYEGERLRDRMTGFFPVNYTMEIESPHKTAREIRETFYSPA